MGKLGPRRRRALTAEEHRRILDDILERGVVSTRAKKLVLRAFRTRDDMRRFRPRMGWRPDGSVWDQSAGHATETLRWVVKQHLEAREALTRYIASLGMAKRAAGGVVSYMLDAEGQEEIEERGRIVLRRLRNLEYENSRSDENSQRGEKRWRI